MKYVKMTIEEASKVTKRDTIVFVAISNLENGNCCDSFIKKRFGECNSILEEAATIVKICDDFAVQLRAFSEYQEDILNLKPKGSLSTILFPNKKANACSKNSVDKNKHTF